MAFARINGPGWATNDKLSSSQINALDIDHAAAVDGGAGGTYAPSAPIIVGGSGMQVPSGATWHVLSGGTLNVDSGGVLTVAAGASMSVGCATYFTAAASIHMASGAPLFADSFTVNAATFAGPTTLGGTTTLGSTTTLAVNGTMTLGATSAATIAAGGTLTLPGSAVLINDTTDIKFTVARGRYITQQLSGIVHFADNDWGIVSGTCKMVMSADGSQKTIQLTKLHDGGTVTLLHYLIFGATHAGALGSHPTLQVFRTELSVGITQSLMSTGAFDVVSAVTTPGFTSSAFALDQNNVIDNSTYAYFLVITSESGANALPTSCFYPPKVWCSNILDMRPQ
jgi:hypothetical protein